MTLFTIIFQNVQGKNQKKNFLLRIVIDMIRKFLDCSASDICVIGTCNDKKHCKIPLGKVKMPRWVFYRGPTATGNIIEKNASDKTIDRDKTVAAVWWLLHGHIFALLQFSNIIIDACGIAIFVQRILE